MPDPLPHPEALLSLDALQEPHVRLDSHLRFTYLNRAAASLFGLPVDAVFGRTPWQVHPDGAGPPLEHNLRLALRENTVVSFELDAFLSRRCRITAQPDHAGGLLVRFCPIAANPEASPPARANADIPRSALDRSGVGYYKIAADGRFVDVNDAWLRLHGFASREEVLGRPFALTQTPEDLPAAETIVESVLRSGSRSAGEFSRRRADGTTAYHTFTAHPVFEGGTLAGVEGFLIDTTGRRLSEDRHRAVEERYRAVLSAMAEGVVFLDDAGRIEFSNESAQRILGLTTEQLAGRSSRDPRWATLYEDGSPFPGDSYPATLTLRTGEPASGVTMGVHKPDGTLTWISINARPLPGSGGVVTTFTDITESKLFHEQLAEALRTVGIAERAARFGVFRWNVKTGASYWSPQFFLLYGLNPQAIDPSPNAWLHQIVHPDDRERVAATLEALLQNHGVDYRCEFRTLHGSRWMLSVGQLFRDAAGRPDHLVGIDIDVTDQKLGEQALQTSEDRYRRLFEIGPDAVVLVDKESGQIADVNPAAVRMYGYSRDEFLALRHVDVSAEPGLSRQSIDRADDFVQLRWHRRKSGEAFPVEIRAAHSTWNGRAVHLAFVREITERMGLEAERARLTQELQEAQKLESVGRLAGGVAHDFNNLLTVVNGYADLLIATLPANGPHASLARHIGKAGQRAAHLTRQLLAFSRKQIFDVRPVDLNAVIRESVEMSQRLLGPGILVQTALDPALGEVLADSNQLHQVLMNLIANARDAMPDGGRLDIVTSNLDIEETTATSHAGAAPGPYVTLAVTDSGQGMDEATRRRIFEPFFTTKPPGQGQGLGLSTVYGIVRQSGGWIDVASSPGQGASFRLYLPRAGSPRVPETAPAAGPSEPPATATILVVEDEHAVRSLSKAILESHGYTVLEAADGPSAELIARQHPGEIHLLLADVILPGMNGRDLSHRLTLARPSLKVVFVSGYAADVLDPGLPLGPAVAFLQKPFTASELAATVREALGPPSSSHAG